jgi:hypothetical protein
VDTRTRPADIGPLFERMRPVRLHALHRWTQQQTRERGILFGAMDMQHIPVALPSRLLRENARYTERDTICSEPTVHVP